MATEFERRLEALLDDTSNLRGSLQSAARELDAARRENEVAKATIRSLEEKREALVQDELMRQSALTKLKDPAAVMNAGDAATRKQQFEAHISTMALHNPDSPFYSLREEIDAARVEEMNTGLTLSAARDHFGLLQAITDLRRGELASLTQLVASETMVAGQTATVSQIHLMAELYEHANLKIQQSRGEQNVTRSEEPSSTDFTANLRKSIGRPQ